MTRDLISDPGVRYVDTHCHVDLYPDPIAVMREAEREGVGIIAVTNTPSVFEPMVRLADGFSKVVVALGIHPELAAEREAELRLLPALIDRTDFLGEIGLDGSSSDAQAAAAQRRVLTEVLRSAAAGRPKVLTVHTRGAVRQSFELIGNEFQGAIILHWFTGTARQIEQAIERRWWFSVNPAMIETAKGRTLLESVPPESVLTETDGPFTRTASGPSRPVNVVAVVEYLATLWRCEHEEARTRILENFRRCTAGDAGSTALHGAWQDTLLRNAPAEISGPLILSAIQELLSSDRELLIRDVNERTITSSLAEHLRPRFPQWSVDCEYNRDGDAIKRAGARSVLPDIIVHRRGAADNLLVIEVKKSNSREPDDLDLEKLRAFRRPPLQYQAALFLKVIVGPDGPGVQTIQWV